VLEVEEERSHAEVDEDEAEYGRLDREAALASPRSTLSMCQPASTIIPATMPPRKR